MPAASLIELYLLVDVDKLYMHTYIYARTRALIIYTWQVQ